MEQLTKSLRTFYKEAQSDHQCQHQDQETIKAEGNHNLPHSCIYPSYKKDPIQHSNRIQAGQQKPSTNDRDPRMQRQEQRRQERQTRNQTERQIWLDNFIDKKKMATHTRIDTEQGIPVYFPKHPYDQQRTYINKLIKCLNRGETVTNAFFESPTGTGKSLCNLTTSLAWIYHQRRQFGGKHRVIYLSRTHSQLDQVIKELNETCYRPTMGIIGSKDKLCINNDIDFKKFNGMKLRQCCKGKVNDWYELKKDRHMDQNEKQQLKMNACFKYENKVKTVNIGKKLKNKIFSINSIKKIAQKQIFCPSYYSQYMQDQFDLILMTYNYLLNVGILQRYSHLIKDSILIFDQAHNVADNACTGRSFHLYESYLKGLKKEITNLDMNLKPVSYQQEKLKTARKNTEEVCKTYQQMISNLEQNIRVFLNSIDFHEAYINKPIKDPSNKGLAPNHKTLWYKIFETDKKLNKYTCVIRAKYVQSCLISMLYSNNFHQQTIDFQKSPKRLKLLDETIQFLGKLLELMKKTYDQFNMFKDAKFYNANEVMKMLGRIMNLLIKSRDPSTNMYFNEILHYCIVFNVQLGEKQQDDRFKIKQYNFSLNCLVPWFTFGDIQSYNPHSIIFTSGTMKPLDDWKHELNLQAITFPNNHVIQPEQIKLNILTHDTKGNIIDFSSEKLWPSKNQEEKRLLKPVQKQQIRKNCYLAVMETIFAIIKQVPGGVIVIFTNKSIKDHIKQYLQKNIHVQKEFYKINQKINTRKKQFFEEDDDDNKNVEQYKSHIQNGKQGILYCVCRGKASEGVDFPNELCRAVIFVGIPFPSYYQPLTNEKMLHYTDLPKHSNNIPQLKHISWNNYYFNQTVRALNQGLGRVIRHKYDYGQIFLLDSRYSAKYQTKNNYNNKNIQNHLPDWASKQMDIWGGSVDETQKKLSEIRRFYDWNAVNTRPPKY